MLEEKPLNPTLYKLLSIGVILYFGLFSFSAILEWIVYTVSLIAGSSTMTANWMGKILSMITVVIVAYKVSSLIWTRARISIQSLDRSFKQTIIVSVVLWILQFVYPILLGNYLLDLMNLQEGVLYSVFPSSWDTTRLILESIETILILIAIAWRK
jgi:hypothetical protein